ncbi:type II toxin-antitoxin system mRNA interferase toxin, RelE/StbE family [Candidatus Woesebacteria bacterium]|nr:type II toxin-antitoxin system mRNA interferase toxin, RelE/StbE family [Candidatus Woesebacteria bacterium]
MPIKFSKSFTKQYDKAPLEIRRAFDQRLKLFVQNSFHPILKNHLLRGSYKGFRSINITGDWRALYKESGDFIIFSALGTHSQLYR